MLSRATLDNRKTDSVRLPDSLGVRYELREYEIDPAVLETETVARKMGIWTMTVSVLPLRE